MKPSIDPKLQKALEADEGPLSVFAKVRAPHPSQDLTLTVEKLVQRVAKKTKQSPRFSFRDLDCVLHVNANRLFIKELLRQPEIVGASMVPNVGSAMIQPLNPREVDESAISEPTYPRRHI